MPNTQWRAITARCPYYRTSSARTITCAAERAGLTMRKHYDDNGDCATHFNKFCACRWKACTMRKLIGKIEE